MLKKLLIIIAVLSITAFFLKYYQEHTSNVEHFMERDPRNDKSYKCRNGATFATYDANTLTPSQKAKAAQLYPGKPPSYYAAVQGSRSRGRGCRPRGNGIMKNVIEPSFGPREGTDTLDLEDKNSIRTNKFVETKKIDPLTYNKQLDNMGKYTEYRKKTKNPDDVLNYKVNYSIIPTKYLDKCGKNGKTYWNYTNYRQSSVGEKSPYECRLECSKSDSCDSYLLDQNSKCHLFEFKSGNIATYNCNKPFTNGEWFGSIKASSKTNVQKKTFPGLNPGDIITLVNPITETALKMNTDRSMVGDRLGTTGKDSKCKWLVVNTGSGGKDIALWNLGTRRFCAVYEDQIAGLNNQSTPSEWNNDRTVIIKSIGNDGGTVTLLNPSLNKMYTINNQDKCVPKDFDKSALFDLSSESVFKPKILVKNTGCYDLTSSTYLGTGNSITECMMIAVKNGQQSFGITNGNQCVSIKQSPTKKISYCSLNNMGGSNKATNIFNISTQEYELLYNTIGSLHYHSNYHIQEGGYGMALGVCGKRGCGGGIGTYPMTGSGSSYYKNNKNKCLWKFVPKGEDENTKKPKSRCDTNNLSSIGGNSNDSSQAIIHYDDVFTIRCTEDDRWLVSCDTFSCGSSSYLAVSANTYNGPSNVFAGNAQYWKFVSLDGKTGPVKFGDRFRLINLWGPTSALATCWHYNCGGVYYEGYSVNTVKINSSNYNSIVSHWFIGEENIEIPTKTMEYYGNRYCKKYSGYSRHRISDLEQCKEKCLNDDTCDAIALKNSDCVTYQNCKISNPNVRQSWGYQYFVKENN